MLKEKYPPPLQTNESRHLHARVLELEREVARQMERERALSVKQAAKEEQLRALTNHLLSIREEERTRISRTVHDELGQALTGLKMDVAWLRRHLDSPQQLLLEHMQMMTGLIDSTIQSVRQISTELRPAMLDNIGLIAAIEWYLEEFQGRTGISCKLSTNADEDTLDANSATALFRILQEALTNIIRHASATEVHIAVEERCGELFFQVRDNGCGIRDQMMHSPSAIGLLGMCERARQLGGMMEICGIENQGTSVTVRLPM